MISSWFWLFLETLAPVANLLANFFAAAFSLMSRQSSSLWGSIAHSSFRVFPLLDAKHFESKNAGDVFPLCPLDALDQDFTLHLLLLCSLLLRLVFLRRLLLFLRQFDPGE